jgi:hypothetical protein
VNATDRDNLPIPDYDHLPLGSLESRIRSLDEAGVEALLVHESKHGDRLPVMNILRQRLQALHGGAKPSSGSRDQGTMPEAAAGSTDPSKVSPQTSGPPVNPPSQGDPTNPAQPRG